ncbi:MAG: dihydrolipoamide acetyltransferase family protein [Candidatus Acidiferrales bacterium]|jgi:2-oxoglutarate dehydrogenase E2 component (dihydrolipoamide succinyltransferase)
MAVNVLMPQMGESIFEGTVTKWLKKPGDKVERDEPLFEISTDKVDAEIPAPAAGILKEIKVPEGQTVPVQTVVAIIDGASAGTGATEVQASNASAPSSAATPGDETPATDLPTAKGKGAAAPAKAEAKAAPAAPAPAVPSAPAAASSDGRRIHSSPLVRRLAKENNVDLAQLSGTGAGGRISKKDILAVIASGGARTAAPGASVAAASAGATAVPRERIYFGRYDVAPMSVMRQKIAEHMVASKRTSPHVYSIEEADMTGIAQLRARVKDEFEKRHETKLTFMPFFLRAAVEALRAFPVVNSSVDGNNLVMHREINLGIAVALEAGLIVPVIRGADEKNFLGLQRAVNDLAERARTKKLKPEEVQDSTFSITNPGSVGGLMGLAVINQPNVAILGIGAIQKRPVVIGDAIGIRSMVYLTLSYDHRAVDGAIAHQFMIKVKSGLEKWDEEIL